MNHITMSGFAKQVANFLGDQVSRKFVIPLLAYFGSRKKLARRIGNKRALRELGYAGDKNHCHPTLRILFSSYYKEKNVMIARKYAFQRVEVNWKKLWPGTTGRGYERKPAMMNGPMKNA